MSKLSNYANASSGKREENIYKLFAYLHTKNTFNPMHLKILVDVSNKTIASYLRTIQHAQFSTQAYGIHLAKPFEQQCYGNTPEHQQAFARKQYKQWQHQYETMTTDAQLLQYQFTSNKHISLDTLYDRLETSLLIYSALK